MSAISRIILGIAVVIGAFVIKGKAAAGNGAVLLFGKETSVATVNLIFAIFLLLGLAMVVMGAVNVMKQRK